MDYYKLKVLNNKKRILIVLTFVLLFVSIGYYFFYYSKEKEIVLKEENSDETLKEEKKQIIQSDNICVDIKGYVAKPGVYTFSENDNARVNDLILKAGGLKKEADTSLINLSKKLEDEMTIIIYSKNEVEKFLNGDNEIKKKLEICEAKIQNNACIENKEVINDKLININTAGKEELMTLDGIGESKAQAIIEYRKKTSFKSIEDIKQVEGIGESLFENIKNNITI